MTALAGGDAGWATALVVVFEIVAVVAGRHLGIDASTVPAPLPADYSNTRELGLALFTRYVYAFELAAVLLLVAIVAAIALTLRRRKDSRAQDPSVQARARPRDRVRLVTMPPEKDA